MKIVDFSLYTYKIPFDIDQKREGLLISMTAEDGKRGWGEISPLPNWSLETLSEVIVELKNTKKSYCKIDWKIDDLPEKISELSHYPSVRFGVESALLSILQPAPLGKVLSACLFKGSVNQIINQADFFYNQGYRTAKLKIGHLSFDEAEFLIVNLKNRFHLRVDVNRAWHSKDALFFFSKFQLNTFEYVEEPFYDIENLKKFSHPLAIDESFPSYLSIQDLEKISNLAALIYKPTIQGGLSVIRPLLKWCRARSVSFILSSAFETDIGLYQIAQLAARLSLFSTIGIGTHFYMKERIAENFQNGFGPYVNCGEFLRPKESLLNPLE